MHNYICNKVDDVIMVPVMSAARRHRALAVLLQLVLTVTAFKHNSIPGYYKMADQLPRKCLDSPLPVRVGQASVVFTGTVRHLDSSTSGDGLETKSTAWVEVKRVIKGQALLSLPVDRSNDVVDDESNERLIVVVGGLGSSGSTAVCHGNAKVNDTWIFLTSVVGGGRLDDVTSGSDVTRGAIQLRLNSSLIRLSLNNIVQVEALVKGTLNAH